VRTVGFLNGGAHRGALQNLPAIAEFNRSSVAVALVPTYADPAPGRSAAIVEEAARQGVIAKAFEGRVQDALATHPGEPLVLNLDRASEMARALSAPDADGRPVLGYIVVELPNWGLRGFRFVLDFADTKVRPIMVAFLAGLGNLTERAGHDAVLGAGAKPAHSLLEPLIRKWFAEHTKANLGKIVSGVEPVTNTFEITTNGSDTVPLFIVSRPEWSDPLALASDVIRSPLNPIRRGTPFAVAEVASQGIRLHADRFRLDGGLTVQGVATIDRAAMDELAARERAEALAVEERARLTAALARAERQTLSRTNPVRTTD
jgi:hypothetical protein